MPKAGAGGRAGPQPSICAFLVLSTTIIPDFPLLGTALINLADGVSDPLPIHAKDVAHSPSVSMVRNPLSRVLFEAGVCAPLLLIAVHP